MSEQKIYQSIPASHTTMKRYSVTKAGSRNQKSKTKKLQKLYTDIICIKNSQNQIMVHRHINNLHQSIHHPTTHKSKQQLLQQNFELKSQNNQLKKELTSLKIANQNQKKKTKNFTSKLNREFRKDFYYCSTQKIDNSSYLMTGIKNQYEQLKEEYKLLDDKHQMMKRTDFIQLANEYKIYSQALQEDNQRLSQKIMQLKSKSQLDKNNIDCFEMSQKVEKLKNKNKSLKQQIHQLKKQDNQHKKVIAFLQKMILNKDNNQYNTNKLVKVHQKAKLQSQKKLQQSEQHYQYLLKQYQNDMQASKTKYQHLMSKQAHIYQNTILEKDQTIKKLQKQVAYLTTLLKYWKPETNQQSQIYNENNSKQMKSIAEHDNPQIYLNAQQKQINVNKIEKQRKKSYNESLHLSQNAVSNQQYSKQRIPTQRFRKTSAFKRKDSARKLRKVSAQEVADLSQHLKFRLIGFDKSLDDIQTYVNAPPSSNQDSWQYQYITHQELYNILIRDPFGLKDPQAQLLTRYIVQDQCQFQNNNVDNSFVYRDQDNQISRRIAKSILRAFIDKFTSPNSQKCSEQWKSIWNRNGAKLETALNSIGPNGTVTKDKWDDIVHGFITGQISEEVKNWIIGKMIIKSEDLSKLQYQVVIELGK